jgi:hypothetical protein
MLSYLRATLEGDIFRAGIVLVMTLSLLLLLYLGCKFKDIIEDLIWL